MLVNTNKISDDNTHHVGKQQADNKEYNMADSPAMIPRTAFPKSILKNKNITKNYESIYQNPNSSFTKSNVSTQDSLLTQRSESTAATEISSNFNTTRNPSNKVVQLEARGNNFIHTNPTLDSIVSPIKIKSSYGNIGNGYNNNSSGYSIQPCTKTFVKNVSKNKIILINDMPYPVELHFPPKISNHTPQMDSKINIQSTNIDSKSSLQPSEDELKYIPTKYGQNIQAETFSQSHQNDKIQNIETNNQRKLPTVLTKYNVQSSRNSLGEGDKTDRQDQRCEYYDPLIEIIEGYQKN